jgi:hypothetical protein
VMCIAGGSSCRAALHAVGEPGHAEHHQSQVAASY